MRWASPGAVALAASLALAAVLAGCSDSGSEDDEPADFDALGLSATATTGVLRGIVVDDAIRPLVNATVRLTPGTPGKDTTTSNLEGAFGFAGLEPGLYFVEASKPGYEPVRLGADVVAGESEPPIVKLQLAPDRSFIAPYFEQYTFDGYIECSTGFYLTPEIYGYDSVCSRPVPPANEPAFTNDRVDYTYPLTGYPMWVQDEMVWDSTQNAGHWLNHNFYYPDPEELDGNMDLFVIGPSPLLNVMNATTAKQFVEGVDYPNGDQGSQLLLRARIFTWSEDSQGAALTLQQRFTIFTTVFYGYTPPEGWLFSSGEPVPAPPA